MAETVRWRVEMVTVEEVEAASRAILVVPGGRMEGMANILLSAVTEELAAAWTSQPFSLITSSWCRAREGRGSTTGLEVVEVSSWWRTEL